MSRQSEVRGIFSRGTGATKVSRETVPTKHVQRLLDTGTYPRVTGKGLDTMARLVKKRKAQDKVASRGGAITPKRMTAARQTVRAFAFSDSGRVGRGTITNNEVASMRGHTMDGSKAQRTFDRLLAKRSVGPGGAPIKGVK